MRVSVVLDEELAQIVEDLRQFRADSTRVEAKRAQQGLPQRIWETLSAFANTPGGGVILLGLDEEAGFAPVGVRDPGRIQAELASVCDQMEPPLRPLIQIHRVDGKAVVSAEVPEVPASQKPCYYRGAGILGGSFIRVADGDRRLTQYEIQLFLDARGQPTYDLEPVRGRTVADLDPDLLGQFLSHLRRKPGVPYRDWSDDRLLRTFRVAIDQDGTLTPTLAGFLAFGTYPQEEFPGLYLSVVRYPSSRPGDTGPAGERLLDNVKVEGSITVMLEEGLRAIRRNIATRAVVRGFLREDLPEYPVEFLREALVNALAHRDYSPMARGTPVQVRVFPDRIEVENPGGLFGPVTEDRLGEPGLQATRNAFLLKILEDLPVRDTGRGVRENRGTGIVSMLEALRRAGMEPAVFQDRRTTFRLIASNAALLDQETLDWLARFPAAPLRDSQRLALAYLKRHQRMTHTDYRRLNPHLDSSAVTRELKELVAQGFLHQHGTRRWTSYTLGTVPPDRAPTPVESSGRGRRARADRREDIVRLLERRGALSAAEIVEELGLRLPGVRYWLAILRREGRVEPTTPHVKSPNVRYRVPQ